MDANRSGTSQTKLIGGKLFDVQNKPLVSIIFDKYDTDKSNIMDLIKLQNLFYDFGSYLTMDELKYALKDNQSMNYEEFMVWWRNSEKFR